MSCQLAAPMTGPWPPGHSRAILYSLPLGRAKDKELHNAYSLQLGIATRYFPEHSAPSSSAASNYRVGRHILYGETRRGRRASASRSKISTRTTKLATSRRRLFDLLFAG